MALTLGELAVRYGCELRGDPAASVERVGTLAEGEAGALGFLANPGYRAQLADTRLTAVVLEAAEADACPCNSLVTPNPYEVYARIAAELYPARALQPGVHASAVTGAGFHAGDGCEIAAGVVIGDDVSLGANVYVGPNCVIGNGVSVGAGSRLTANVTLYDGVTMGERCCIHANTVIGSDGFGNAQTSAGWISVPQVGSVVLGDDVDIGANTAIDCGAIEDTRIGNNVRIDNLVQIGHNVVIGDHTAIAGQSGVAGSARIGRRCLIGGSVAINGHIDIVDDVIVMGRGNVSRSIDSPGVYSNAFAVEEAGKWRRIAARIKRLDSTASRIRKLESAVKSLTGSGDKTE